MFKRGTLGATILYWIAAVMFAVALVAAWSGAVHALTYKELAAQFEEKNSLPPGLLQAICEIESQWRPHAIGQDGEIGLCQLKPSTLHMLCPNCDPEVLLNPYNNLHWAGRYLAWLRQVLGTSDPAILAAAYNGGQKNGTVNYLLKFRRLHNETK
jgi:soluble lytic murein transglycosylase-like protein